MGSGSWEVMGSGSSVRCNVYDTTKASKDKVQLGIRFNTANEYYYHIRSFCISEKHTRKMQVSHFLSVKTDRSWLSLIIVQMDRMKYSASGHEYNKCRRNYQKHFSNSLLMLMFKNDKFACYTNNARIVGKVSVDRERSIMYLETQAWS